MSLKANAINRFFILVLLVPLIFITGCFEIEMQTNINADGSGQRVMSVIVDKEVAKQISYSPSKSGLPEGVRIKSKNKGSKTYFQTEIDFDDASMLNEQLSSLGEKEGQVATPSKIRLTKRDYGVIVFYAYEERFTKPEDSKLADPFQSSGVDPNTFIKGSSVTYKLTLPGKIDKAKSNARTFAGNNTAIWNLPLSGSSTVKAQATLIRFWVIVALGIVAFALILMLLAIVGSYIYKRIKRSP